MNLGTLGAKRALAYNGVWIDPARPAHHAAPLDRAQRAGDGGWAGTTPPWACCGPCSCRGGPLHAHDTGTRSLPAGAFQLRFFHRQPALMQGMYAGLARRIFE